MPCEPNLLAQAMWLAPTVALCVSAVLVLCAVILRAFFWREGEAEGEAGEHGR